MSTCISPVKIPSPVLSHRNKFIYVPCGKCAWCRRQKRNEWCLRFEVESEDNIFTSFVTLTYDDDHLPSKVDEYGEIKNIPLKSDVQKFLKRLRKMGHKFKYFIVSEYGSNTHRPHYHGIFFSNNDLSVDIDRQWNKGFTASFPATPGAMQYVTKYILKGNDREDNFMLCSRRPAIGASYIKRERALQTYRLTPDGTKNFLFPGKGGNLVPMPAYYKRKLAPFLDPLDYDINKLRIIQNMENSGKFDRIEKKFIDRGYDFDNKKLLEHIYVQYDRDNLKQIQINLEDKL